MTGFEYKVVPAPMRGLKAKGIKGTPARFANALETTMNELGAQGWDYQRTDTLPVEERQGLTGKTTSFQNMLVFRRVLEIEQDKIEVAALIEDHSDITDTAPTEVAEVVIEDAGQAEPVADSVDMNTQGEQSQDAKARVNETLDAPFVFPWNKRNATDEAGADESSHRAAE